MRTSRPRSNSREAASLPRRGHSSCEVCVTFSIMDLQSSANRQSPELVIFVIALAYYFWLALPATFTQLGNHLLADSCSWSLLDLKYCHWLTVNFAIRYLTFTASEFAAGPAQSGLLTQEESFAILMNISAPGEFKDSWSNRWRENSNISEWRRETFSI